MKKSRLCIYADEDKIYEKTYMAMRPPEMERLVLDIDKFMDQAGIKRETVREISFKLEACEA